MSDERPKPEQDEKGRFVAGNTGGGRPKGARGRLGEAFLKAMLADFEEHGDIVVATVRAEKPDQYLKIVASILPQEVKVDYDGLDALTDEQITRQLSAIFAAAQAAGLDLAAGIGAAEAPQQAPGVPTVQ